MLWFFNSSVIRMLNYANPNKYWESIHLVGLFLSALCFPFTLPFNNSPKISQFETFLCVLQHPYTHGKDCYIKFNYLLRLGCSVSGSRKFNKLCLFFPRVYVMNFFVIQPCSYTWSLITVVLCFTSVHTRKQDLSGNIKNTVYDRPEYKKL